MRTVLLFFLISAPYLAWCDYPWEPIDRSYPTWIFLHESYKNNTRDNAANINVLFYGDSITYSWRTEGNETFNQYYASLGTANYGIPGDRIEHLLYRLLNGEIEGLDPDLIVLKIGTNNLYRHNDEEIVAGVLTVIDNLLMKLRSSKLLLLSILPRTPYSWNARIKNINSEIQKKADGFRVRWFDMFDVFSTAEDQLVEEYYLPDLLHLSSEGYAAWAEAMAPIFDEMIGRK